MNWLNNTKFGMSAWWSWWLGVCVIGLCFVVLGSVPLALFAIRSAALTESLMSPRVFAALLFPSLMLGVGVLLAQTMVHRRPMRALVTATSFRWPLLWQGIWGWCVVLVVATSAESFLFPGRYVVSWDWAQWWRIAPLALLLIPLQATAEELVFRGYVMQAMARLIRHPFLIIVLSGVVFMLPHLSNPEMNGALGGAVPMACNYLGMGMGLAWLSIRDNGIERAIGIHVCNNVFAGVVVGYHDSVLMTPTIWQATVLDAWFGVLTLVIGFLGIGWYASRVPR